MLDDATLDSPDVSLLKTFAEDEELDVWHTRGDLEPRLEIKEGFKAPAAMGGAMSVHALSREAATMFGIYGVERLRQRAAEIVDITDGSEDDVFSALAYAAAADEMDADGYVTRRSYLRESESPRTPAAFAPEDAFALVGLVRRARGNSSLGHDMMNVRLHGSTYYFVLERELLRDAWPWFSAIVASGIQSGDDSLIYLGQTARERFTRVLQIRERLHIAAKGEPTPLRGDEVVFQLETLLLFFSAAFDAAARWHTSPILGATPASLAGDASPGADVCISWLQLSQDSPPTERAVVRSCKSLERCGIRSTARACGPARAGNLGRRRSSSSVLQRRKARA